jgi:hypothetical protein
MDGYSETQRCFISDTAYYQYIISDLKSHRTRFCGFQEQPDTSKEC